MEINNRKANYNYNIIDKIECGIVLTGSEVKSCANNSADISEGYALIEKNEVYIYNVNISCYNNASWQNHEPIRKRKLLLHKKEILKLFYLCRDKHYSLIPIKLYLNKGKFKILIGICSPKKNYDKRDSIKNRELSRELKRILK